MFRTKKDKKYIEEICKNSISRKSPLNKKNLFINQNETNVNVQKIKSFDEYKLNIVLKQNWTNNLIYWLPWENYINTYGFKTNVDIIFCDSKFKVIEIRKNINKNSNIECPNKTFNIWVCKIGFIDFYNININDYISTKPI